jgi:hypothetical protein
MGFGPFSSESRTSSKVNQYDQRVTATDNALAAQPRVGGTGNTAAQAINGIAVSGKGNIVNLTDGGAFQTAAGLVTDILKVQSVAQTAAQDAALNAISDANDQISKLSETKLTEGANLNQKTTIVALVVFGVIGLVAYLFLRK